MIDRLAARTDLPRSLVERELRAYPLLVFAALLVFAGLWVATP